MTKSKAPVVCPKGSRVKITQGYKKDLHDSIDFVITNDSLSDEENKFLTFGASLVAILPTWKCIASDWKDKTVGMYGQEAPSGGFIDIQGYYNEQYDMIIHYQHNCINKFKVGDTGVYGEVVGNMGNAGLCLPIPTPDYPVDGTHCHLTMYLRGRGQYDNAIRVNPMDYIDFTTWFDGEDSSKEIDNERRIWGLNKKGFTENWQKIVYLIKRWYIGKW